MNKISMENLHTELSGKTSPQKSHQKKGKSVHER